MVQAIAGWNFVIQRGPDWLFLRPEIDSLTLADEPPLAEWVWNLLEQNMTYRVVLELDDLPLLSSFLLGQMILLQKRVHTHGGVLRLCGLSDHNREVLNVTRLEARLPHFSNREDAVLGSWPSKPR